MPRPRWGGIFLVFPNGAEAALCYCRILIIDDGKEAPLRPKPRKKRSMREVPPT